MNETQSTVGTGSVEVDPMKFTQERLTEIGQVWVAFAKQRVQTYSDKLPPAVKKYFEPKSESPTGDASAESGAM